MDSFKSGSPKSASKFRIDSFKSDFSEDEPKASGMVALVEVLKSKIYRRKSFIENLYNQDELEKEKIV